MTYDYRKLKGRIAEMYQNRKTFAKALDISPSSLSCKLRNKTPFSQREIVTAASLLGISAEESGTYFFAEEVQNI